MVVFTTQRHFKKPLTANSVCHDVVSRGGALRVTCAYRSVSDPAVLVIAGCIPIDLLAAESKRIYKAKRIYEAERTSNDKNIATQERQQMLLNFEEQRQAENVVRLNARIIGEVKPWFNRGYGDVNNHITQFLSG
ncbi:uncharacterized protein LOC117169886 [Belonocnema kinseyi]|uniref:uncharacterized protein LOC117169886 n=1 Tax=Belonocnema kinseyi TaxID=2817044 RepID=UPI00143CD9A3|nr:uncharacterized protein LOC117169886 [Belonocnema kinseyi]